ncbi:MAG: enoyl-CoA hydratase-related protein [Pseudomonadales bacterium]|jgi:enoyl-CoA hydratase|nr:enoyl-CoA hydratase-related protein [Pseudomonadales bacterium]MDP6472792.1 enoyl-CoA hydratase-related protein [Pseudomonadales bacterium]MDP6828005.1 enoyl-CoA hydratase-related protein [Pseudomonadales bacterium]MDP6972904.1 enoyl-CoA hydratase-related protein [Pseudomonadales bacterium]|tara:strand:- start:572 stop:1369 length:798 start_codon:yes stop_codon:yes gene_type:complete
MNDADYQTLRFDTLDGDVLKITIDHPNSAMNAVDGLLHEEFTRLFHELKQQDGARAVLLTGEGRAFSAGGDFSWFPTLQDPVKLEHLRRDAKQLIWDLLEVELPIVCALNGAAAGLGASIALLCDTIYMAKSAVIVDPHVRVGIVAGDGGTVIWPMAIGPALAKQYLMTGDAVRAEEAFRLGLVNFVCDDATVVDEALAFARRLAVGAPLAVQYTKQAVNKLVKDNLNVAFDHATALEIVTFKSEDHREALAAHMEKRKPRFKGI